MVRPSTGVGGAEASTFIGERLRSLRGERGLSLRELAERSDVSASLLSQLERDITNPSVDTIYRVAHGLGISIFALLRDAPAAATVVRADRRRRLVISDGALSYELLSPDTTGQLEVWMGRMAPLTEMGNEASMHPSEEFILVLEGAMEIVIDAENHRLEPGDSIQYDGNHPHRIASIGDAALTFLSALTPPTL